jgi:uncharacterized phiE125 gp8 family phage protein
MNHTRRTAAPARRAVTLADALAQVREYEGDNGAGDVLLEQYIAAAHDACELRTERALITSDWLLTLDAFPAACRFNPHAAMALLRCPVQEVLSIKYDDADGVEKTLAGSAYRASLTQEPAQITPAVGTNWPTTLAAPGAVRVAFRAGFGDVSTDVPAPLRSWILLAVGDMYERRNASAEQPATPHQFVDGLLQPYRLMGV